MVRAEDPGPVHAVSEDFRALDPEVVRGLEQRLRHERVVDAHPCVGVGVGCAGRAREKGAKGDLDRQTDRQHNKPRNDVRTLGPVPRVLGPAAAPRPVVVGALRVQAAIGVDQAPLPQGLPEALPLDGRVPRLAPVVERRGRRARGAALWPDQQGSSKVCTHTPCVLQDKTRQDKTKATESFWSCLVGEEVGVRDVKVQVGDVEVTQPDQRLGARPHEGQHLLVPAPAPVVRVRVDVE